MHQFKYHQGALHCEEVNLQTLAQDHGTPLYVYSSQTLRNNYKRLHEALGKLRDLQSRQATLEAERRTLASRRLERC